MFIYSTQVNAFMWYWSLRDQHWTFIAETYARQHTNYFKLSVFQASEVHITPNFPVFVKGEEI
jgi:hypothetical protein